MKFLSDLCPRRWPAVLALATVLVVGLLVPAVAGAGVPLMDGDIVGFVTNVDTGAPVEAAWVSLQELQGPDWVDLQWTYSDPYGRYALSNMAPGDYRVRVEAQHFVTDTQPVSFVGDPVFLNLPLTPVPLIATGTVTDAATGKPLPAAEIVLYYQDYTATDWVVADFVYPNEKGYYEVASDFGAGYYQVVVSCYGYATDQSTEFEYMGGAGEVAKLDFALAPLPVELSGTITDAANDYPISFADATLEKLDPDTLEWSFFEWAIADDMGLYQFWGLEPGSTYRVVGAAMGYYSATTDGFIYGGEPITGMDLALSQAPPDLSGMVTDAVTGDPLEYCMIEAQYYDGDFNEWITVSFGECFKGKYELWGLAPDVDYRIVAMADGYFDAMIDIYYTGPTTLDIELQPRPVVAKGFITNAVTHQPLEGATAELWFDDPVDGWVFIDGVSSAADGSYALRATSASAGTYRVDYYKHGFAPQQVASLSFTGATALIDKALVPLPLSIDGYTRDIDTEDPVPFSWVGLSKWEGGLAGGMFVQVQSTWSDENGHFAFYDLEPGADYRIDAYAPRYLDYQGDSFTYSGDVIDSVVWLSKAAPGVTGTVRDAQTLETVPWSGVDLLYFDPQFGAYDWADWTETSNGSFEFWGLSNNTVYSLFTYAMNYYDAQSPPFLYLGDTHVEDVYLDPYPVAVTGTIVDDAIEPMPVAGATALLYRQGPSGQWWVDGFGTSDGAGAYKLSTTETGVFKVSVNLNGYLAWESEPFEWLGGDPQIVDVMLQAADPGVSGMIRSAESGLPVQKADVFLQTFDAELGEWIWVEWAFTNTGAGGGYTLYGLTEGVEYRVGAWAADYVEAFSDPFVYEGSLVTLDVLMQPFDTTAPLVESDAVASYTGVAPITITASDPSIPLTIYYKLDDQPTEMVVDATNVAVTTAQTGDHTLNFWAKDAAGNVSQATFVAFTVADGFVDRVSGATRYSGSAVMAAEQFDPAGDGSWPSVSHIVIASGDDRAAADPLAAAGLCGAYDAPLFLVSQKSVDQSVLEAIRQIVAANGAVTMHVVGGVVSVPDARLNEINAYAGGTLTSERVLASGGRFELAAAIAARVSDVRGTPATVLIANGSDSTKFFDALALSPIAAAKGYPILLVSTSNVPAATTQAIADIKADGGADSIVIGGGAKTVSDGVKTQLGATRWAGNTRYTTATTIADNAVGAGWLGYGYTGIAAKLPDALTGGSLIGRLGGVLVLTDGASLTPETGTWLTAHKSQIGNVYLYGGDKSLTGKVAGQIAAALQ